VEEDISQQRFIGGPRRMGPGVRRDDDLNSIEAVIASEAIQEAAMEVWLASRRSQ
jgi:hypothetical protein